MAQTDKTKEELIEEIKLLQKQIAAKDINSKKTEEELRRKKQDIEFILGTTKTGLDIIDSDFNMVYIDPQWRKIYGEYKGRKCYRYFMGKSKICLDCGVKKALETKKPVVSEEVLRREGNRPIQVTTIPFQNEKGKWMVAEVNVDITERKKAEEKIKVFSDAIASAFDCFILTDMKGNIAYANESTSRTFGYTPEELLKLNIAKLEFDPKVAKKAMQGVAVKGKWSGEVNNIKKNKGKFTSLLSAFVIKDEKGNPKFTMGILRDITELKKAEERLAGAKADLEEQKLALERKNIALRVIIEQIEIEKNKIKDDVLTNVNELMMPILKKLRAKGVTHKYIDLLGNRLQELASSLGRKLTKDMLKLTPKEIEICNLIEGGLASKEIADFLNVSRQTVEKHRKDIRKKLGLGHKKINLTTYLQKKA
jgi:PAS domain S-box-containing protein